MIRRASDRTTGGCRDAHRRARGGRGADAALARADRSRPSTRAYNLDHAEAMALPRQGRRGRSERRGRASRRRASSPGCASASCAARSRSTTISAASASPTSTCCRRRPTRRSAFRRTSRARSSSRKRSCARRPRDPDAHFRIGAVVGMQASYGATVEGKMLASFRAARRAYDAHERVLELDPSRKDAGLIVGTYRYIVSALSLPMRLMAYVAGFGGGRERGLRMIEEAARLPGPDADRREIRACCCSTTASAASTTRCASSPELQKQYPRNRQLWYEAGATLIRAGIVTRRPRRCWTKGIAPVRQRQARADVRRGSAVALQARRRARAARPRRRGARTTFSSSLQRQARDWVRGRAHAELGQLALKAGDREQARREYRLAIELATRGNDPAGTRRGRGAAARAHAER